MVYQLILFGLLCSCANNPNSRLMLMHIYVLSREFQNVKHGRDSKHPCPFPAFWACVQHSSFGCDTTPCPQTPPVLTHWPLNIPGLFCHPRPGTASTFLTFLSPSLFQSPAPGWPFPWSPQLHQLTESSSLGPQDKTHSVRWQSFMNCAGKRLYLLPIELVLIYRSIWLSSQLLEDRGVY